MNQRKISYARILKLTQGGWQNDKLRAEKKEGFMKKSRNLKSIPHFQNEDQERIFWAKHDTTDYFDTQKPIVLDLSALQPSTKSVTIRLPESLLTNLKILAHQKDVPYQSLMKVYLSQYVQKECQVAGL